MSTAQRLLAAAIASVVGKSEERAVSSLFTSGGTYALRGEFAGINDFEVVAFLVILPGAESMGPSITRTDFATFTLKFQKPGGRLFSVEEKKACVLESQFALGRMVGKFIESKAVGIDITYVGEGDGSFWVDLGVTLLAINSVFGGLANTIHVLGMTLEQSGAMVESLGGFMQKSGQWLKGGAWRLTPQPGTAPQRPGCFGVKEWLDRRTKRCRDCGFLTECFQRIDQMK